MMNHILILCLISLAAFVSVSSSMRSCPGCPVKLEGDDLKRSEEVLNNSLSKLAAGDGPSYTLVELNYATKQVVSGSLYKFNADLEDEDGYVKTCDIEILSQTWLENGITVTFNCPGEGKVTKKHSP